MADDLWRKAISKKGLQAGWHLARAELLRGFFHDFLHEQAVAQNLSAQIDEISRLLQTRSYRFRPLRQVPIPKSALSTRPGSHVPLRDRIVLWSIVRQIAKIFDKSLDAGVYSYRIKENPTKGELFKESDILSIPFLKSNEIRGQLDPFDPWYAAWPDFEQRTKEVIGEGYNYLAVSDISGYFENINIDILKDQIISHLNNEPILCNFIANSFSDWVNTSQFGFRPRRGIPQGTGVSSFFGNIYLAPVDDAFKKFRQNNDIIYIRYMDDIRIFAKDINVARKAIFLLEKEVRDLHLNLQSSKTKIYRESSSNKEITNALFDDRVDKLTNIRSLIEQDKISSKEVIRRLHSIARQVPLNNNSARLLSLSSASNALTDRAMRMWMNMLNYVGGTDHLKTLMKQILHNPDQRLSRIYVNACVEFPRYSRLGVAIENFVVSEYNVHQQQEAELIRAARYLSDIPEALWKRALSNVLNKDVTFQLRIQSLLLLGIRGHSDKIYNNVFEKMNHDVDIDTHPYYISILGQLREPHRSKLIDFYRYHANQHNQEFGLLLNMLDTDFSRAKNLIDFIFGDDRILTDWQGVLFFIAQSGDYSIRNYLSNSIKQRLKGGGRQLLLNRLRAVLAAANSIV